jgi:hypothetical protein
VLVLLTLADRADLDVAHSALLVGATVTPPHELWFTARTPVRMEDALDQAD